MWRNLLLSMLMIAVLTLGLCESASAAAHRDQGAATISVRVSEDAQYRTEMNISEQAWDTRYLQDPEEVKVVPLSDAYLTLRRDGRSSSYLIDEHGFLYDVRSLVRYSPPELLRIQMTRHIEHLREQHYGSMGLWDSMSKRFPRKDIFHVTDLETGLTFRVQRRAGSSHADVQPLTREDTEVMKTIYNGKWSWKRRAILVGHEDDLKSRSLYAASMHGMPHGGDGIPDNNFSGHFCIHFRDSRTHGSGQVDFDHQLMVLKAAGELSIFYEDASPSELAHSFFTSLNQRDKVLLHWCFAYLNHPQSTFFLDEMRRIASLHVRVDADQNRSLQHALAGELQVEAELYREGEGRIRQVFTFLMTRDTYRSPWKIDHISLVS